MISEDSASSLISTVEAALIRYYKPIWNTQIDGFGNHDPGKGRYNQAKSEEEKQMALTANEICFLIFQLHYPSTYLSGN